MINSCFVQRAIYPNQNICFCGFLSIIPICIFCNFELISITETQPMWEKIKEFKIPPFLKNKYIIAIILVLIWLLFFDNNNFVQQYKFSRDLKRLKAEREYYIREIEKDSLIKYNLENNPEALERFAREQYYMKKENEDIFIIKQDQQ